MVNLLVSKKLIHVAICSATETHVLSGSPVSATSVVGLDFYYLTIPDSNSYFITVKVQETGM